MKKLALAIVWLALHTLEVETLTFLCSIPIFSFYVEIPTKFNNFLSIDILYENVFQNESNKKQFDKLN